MIKRYKMVSGINVMPPDGPSLLLWDNCSVNKSHPDGADNKNEETKLRGVNEGRFRMKRQDCWFRMPR